MTKLQQAADLGQSIWLDYIRRDFVQDGSLQALIDDGLRGITSNPSIFSSAIANSDAYDDDLAALGRENKSPEAIFEALAVADIQSAADLLRPLYDESDGVDGYISLEVNPELAYDTESTIQEVRRLFELVDRPNVMIKVPATAAGIPAIATLIGEGININVTLMFSLEDYDAVSDAFLRGLERRAARGENIDRIASVASFFVSRVDTQVDRLLETIDDPRASGLRGRIGIANAKMAYARYLTLFSSERWHRLAGKGARPQRLLWGSTSVKNPNYPDTMYVDELMGANTVNTVPPETVDAFRDHGTVSSGLTQDLDRVRQQLVDLALVGVDLSVITQQLQDDGVTKFADAYDAVLDTIEEKIEALPVPG